MEHYNDILKKTYETVSQPANRHPLNKLVVQPSLSTTVKEVQTYPLSTKYCKFNEDYEKISKKFQNIDQHL